MNLKIHAVIETAIYVDDLDAAEDFDTSNRRSADTCLTKNRSDYTG
jgi:hypothetical protein